MESIIGRRFKSLKATDVCDALLKLGLSVEDVGEWSETISKKVLKEMECKQKFSKKLHRDLTYMWFDCGLNQIYYKKRLLNRNNLQQVEQVNDIGSNLELIGLNEVNNSSLELTADELGSAEPNEGQKEVNIVEILAEENSKVQQERKLRKGKGIDKGELDNVDSNERQPAENGKQGKQVDKRKSDIIESNEQQCAVDIEATTGIVETLRDENLQIQDSKELYKVNEDKIGFNEEKESSSDLGDFKLTWDYSSEFDKRSDQQIDLGINYNDINVDLENKNRKSRYESDDDYSSESDKRSSDQQIDLNYNDINVDLENKNRKSRYESDDDESTSYDNGDFSSEFSSDEWQPDSFEKKILHEFERDLSVDRYQDIEDIKKLSESHIDLDETKVSTNNTVSVVEAKKSKKENETIKERVEKEVRNACNVSTILSFIFKSTVEQVSTSLEDARNIFLGALVNHKINCLVAIRQTRFSVNGKYFRVSGKCRYVKYGVHDRAFLGIIFPKVDCSEVWIFSTETEELDNHGEDHLFRPRRGVDRRKLKNELLLTTPFQYTKNQFRGIDKAQIKKGNTDNQDGKGTLMSYGAIRKANSERKNEDRSDLCNVRDVLNIFIERPFEFVRDVIITHEYPKSNGTFTSEFGVILIHETIFELIRKYKPQMLWLDATGNVVEIKCCKEKETKHNESRILNHMGVFKCGPLTVRGPQMLSSMGNTDTIKKWLKSFKFYVCTVNRVPWTFKYYIVDWNFPYIHALCEEYNGVSLVQYLNLIYTGKISELKSNTKGFILSCVSHFVHCISLNCKKHYPFNDELRKSIIQVFCVLVNSSVWDVINRVVYLAVFIFSSKYDSVELSDMKAELSVLIQDQQNNLGMKDVMEYMNTNVSRDVNDECESTPVVREKGLRANIQYYKVFLSIVDQARADSDSANITVDMNNLYDENETCILLLDRYMPFAPIFTKLCYGDVFDKRMSTGTIESENREMKLGQMGGEENVRPGFFIRKSNEYEEATASALEDESLLKSVLCGAPQKKNVETSSSNDPPLSLLDNKDELDRHTEDPWCKGRRGAKFPPKPTHINADSLLKSLETNVVKPSCKEISQSASSIKKTRTNEPKLSTVDLTNEPDPSEELFEYEKHEFSSNVKEFICKNARKLQTYPTFIVKEQSYYDDVFYYAKYDNMWLRVDDFNSLQYSSWLDINVIEFYLRMMISRLQMGHLVRVLSMTEVMKLFHPKSRNERVREKVFLSAKEPYLILPIYNGSDHFSLALVDQTKYQFYVLDSLYPNDKATARSHLKDWLKVRKDEDSNWELILPSHPKQKDTSNCGVYVIYFALKFVEGISRPYIKNRIDFDFDFKFNAMIEREQIKENIRNTSDCLEKICLKCLKVIDENDNFLMHCYSCERFMHLLCFHSSIGSIIFNEDLNEILCLHCTHFFNRSFNTN